MKEILEVIDQEIAKLQQVRSILTTRTDVLTSNAASAKRRGRPMGSVDKTVPVIKKSTKRTLSTQGKARIAEAQKARWAARRLATEAATAASKKKTTKTAKKVDRKGAKISAPTKRPVKSVPETEAAAAESNQT